MVDFPHRSMDKRPRKRPRLAWDLPPAVPPAPPKVRFFQMHLALVANFAIAFVVCP